MQNLLGIGHVMRNSPSRLLACNMLHSLVGINKLKLKLKLSALYTGEGHLI